MRAIGVGELLWDLLPTGPRLGGAPFNVIAHLGRLGCDTGYFTAVGVDELGTRALDEVRRLHVGASFIQIVSASTGVARVRLDAHGVPEYDIVSPAAYEALSAVESTNAVGAFDILVFGTLAQRSEGTFLTTRWLAEAQPTAVRLYDVNLRPGCWNVSLVEQLLGLATVVKMNEEEASILAEALSLDPDCTMAWGRSMSARFGLEAVCVTRGPRGAALFCDGTYREAAAVPVHLVDTVGAGDAFAAGLAFGIAVGWTAEQVLDLGTRLASLVASRPGAIPDWDPSDLGMEIPQSNSGPGRSASTPQSPEARR
jgi:fructokinase